MVLNIPPLVFIRRLAFDEPEVPAEAPDLQAQTDRHQQNHQEGGDGDDDGHLQIAVEPPQWQLALDVDARPSHGDDPVMDADRHGGEGKDRTRDRYRLELVDSHDGLSQRYRFLNLVQDELIGAGRGTECGHGRRRPWVAIAHEPLFCNDPESALDSPRGRECFTREPGEARLQGVGWNGQDPAHRLVGLRGQALEERLRVQGEPAGGIDGERCVLPDDVVAPLADQTLGKEAAGTDHQDQRERDHRDGMSNWGARTEPGPRGAHQEWSPHRRATFV
jgi:hypothetical protein